MILNIIMISVIGLITIYTDLKWRVIKNKVVLLGLISAPFIHIYSILENPSLAPLIPFLAQNVLFSIFIAVLLWYTHIWPAGDAKLFIAYSSLLPLDVFAVTKSFLSFDFLINTFVPIFFLMFGMLLLRSKKSDIKKSLKKAFDPYTLSLSTIVIIGFLWAILEFMEMLGVPQNYLIQMVMLFLIIEVFNKIIRFNMEYLYVVFAVIRILIDYRGVFSFDFAYYLITLLLLFISFRYFVVDLAFRSYTRRKHVKELRVGDCLAEGIIKKDDGKYDKEEITQYNIIQILKDRKEKKYIHGTSFSGLSENEVAKIKKLHKEGKLNFEIVSVHTITPFALFLFLGVLMTSLFGTNFVLFLRNLLG